MFYKISILNFTLNKVGGASIFEYSKDSFVAHIRVEPRCSFAVMTWIDGSNYERKTAICKNINKAVNFVNEQLKIYLSNKKIK